MAWNSGARVELGTGLAILGTSAGVPASAALTVDVGLALDGTDDCELDTVTDGCVGSDCAMLTLAARARINAPPSIVPSTEPIKTARRTCRLAVDASK